MPSNRRFLFSTKIIDSNTNDEIRKKYIVGHKSTEDGEKRSNSDSTVFTYSISNNNKNHSKTNKTCSILKFLCEALKLKYLHYNFETMHSSMFKINNTADLSIPVHIKSIDHSPISDEIVFEVNEYLISTLEIIASLVLEVNSVIKTQSIQGVVLCREINKHNYDHSIISENKYLSRFVEYYFQPSFEQLTSNVTTFIIPGHDSKIKLSKPEMVKNNFQLHKTSIVFGYLTRSNGPNFLHFDGVYVDNNQVTNIRFNASLLLAFGPNSNTKDFFDDKDHILSLNTKLYVEIQSIQKFISIEKVMCGKYRILSYSGKLIKR